MIQDQVSSWGSQSQSGGLLKRWNNSALSKALLVPWLFVSVGGLAVCHSWLHRHGLNLVVLLGLPPAALPPIRLSNSGGPPPHGVANSRRLWAGRHRIRLLSAHVVGSNSRQQFKPAHSWFHPKIHQNFKIFFMVCMTMSMSTLFSIQKTVPPR